MGCATRTVTTRQEVLDYTCDICGRTIPGNNTCRLCGRYLCITHIASKSYKKGQPDTTYCQSCWDAGIKERAAIDALVVSHNSHVDALHESWKLAAQAKLKEARDVSI